MPDNKKKKPSGLLTPLVAALPPEPGAPFVPGAERDVTPEAVNAPVLPYTIGGPPGSLVNAVQAERESRDAGISNVRNEALAELQANPRQTASVVDNTAIMRTGTGIRAIPLDQLRALEASMAAQDQIRTDVTRSIPSRFPIESRPVSGWVLQKRADGSSYLVPASEVSRPQFKSLYGKFITGK